MPYIEPRSITEQESRVIEALLSRAPIAASSWLARGAINKLVVHSKCDCGCASIGFLPESEKAPNETGRLADGLGLTANHQEVGLLLYGTDEKLVELEIYWHETDPAPLPLAETIVPWEQGVKLREAAEKNGKT